MNNVLRPPEGRDGARLLHGLPHSSRRPRRLTGRRRPGRWGAIRDLLRGGGAAALALGERTGGRTRTAERLEEVAALASIAHLAAGEVAERRRRAVGVARAMAGPERQRLATAGGLATVALPVAAYALNRATRGRAPAASVAGSFAVLAGGFFVRHAILRTGKASTRRPAAVFRLAQPENLPQLGAPHRRELH